MGTQEWRASTNGEPIRGLICTPDFDLEMRVLFLPYKIWGASRTHIFSRHTPDFSRHTLDFYKVKKIVRRQNQRLFVPLGLGCLGFQQKKALLGVGSPW